MKYIATVKLKDVCEKILYIILDTEIKKYKLKYGNCIINLFEKYEMFEKNIHQINDCNNKIHTSIKIKGGDYISSSSIISFKFETEEELFYFQLKTGAVILKIEEEENNI